MYTILADISEQSALPSELLLNSIASVGNRVDAQLDGIRDGANTRNRPRRRTSLTQASPEWNQNDQADQEPMSLQKADQRAVT